MLIHARRRHIENGERSHSDRCPVALAFKDATGQSLSAGWECLYSGEEVFKTPVAVKRFIARFDAGKPVNPFAFVLK